MRKEGDSAMPNTLYRRAPLGVLARLRSGENTSGDSFSKDDSLPTPVYGANGVIGSTSLEPNIQRESILIGRVGSCGEINVAPPSSFASENVLVVDLYEQAHRGWMYYVLLSSKLKDLNTSTAQPLITASKIHQLRVPFPSMMDQQRIADYLDEETSRIDNTVRTLDELIEEMKSRRVQLIQESISSSDSYVGSWEFAEINPSSCEGMSDIKSVKLAHLVKFGNGQDWKSVVAQDGAFPVYGSGGKFGVASDFLHDGEAVLFGRKGTVDRPIYVNEKFWTVDTMYYAIPHRDRCSGKYLYYWSTTIPFKTITTNTALPSVTSMDLSQLYVPLPPLETQQRIADYLDAETAKIDKIISTATELRSELLARRSAIITEVVMGKKKI